MSKDTLIFRDHLTGLLTPYSERQLVPKQDIVGEVYVDWQDMHSAHYRWSDEAIDEELRCIARFLLKIFEPLKCCVFLTRITGDDFRVCSTQLTTAELLNILHQNRGIYPGIAQLVCGPGFISTMSQEIYEFFATIPQPFQHREQPPGTSIATIDFRHLFTITSDLGVVGVEGEVRLFMETLESSFSGGIVWRPRSDEVWVAAAMSSTHLEQALSQFSGSYKEN